MSELLGNITLTKRLRRNAVWERSDYGYCWVDLLLLANDQERETFIQGEKVALKRGQLAWSLRSLEKEWKKSGEWVSKFLSFCKDEGMITVETSRRYTVITLLNYEAYNPCKTDTDTVTEPDTKTDTDTVTEPEQKGEVGNGKRKGERANPPEIAANGDFAEVPAEAEVLAVARSYPGDLARGIPVTIPEVWALDWFRYKVGAGTLPKKWREKMAQDFQRDWVSGHPKARALRPATGGLKKNGASPDGRTPAQQRFELSRELEQLQERLDACYANESAPEPKDKAREKELKLKLKELTDQSSSREK